MKLARSMLLLSIVSLCLGALGTADTKKTETLLIYQAQKLSFPEYLAELDRISALADQSSENQQAADEAISRLRGGWSVVAGKQELEINTGWPIEQFEKLKKNSDSGIRTELLKRLGDLKSEALAFQKEPADAIAARTTLNQILARSEFHQVHGPTWLDRLKFRILEWIFRQLSRFFGSSSAPAAGRILVWILVLIAVITLAFFVYRTLRRSAKQESAIPQIMPVSAKQWRIWMSEAQEAAANGLWREAVHLAYWAGISFLEERSAWRPDKARTPREYLRLLPAASEHRPALSALTRQLEVTWYGNDPAGPDTFSETVTLLENLGCRQA